MLCANGVIVLMNTPTGKGEPVNQQQNLDGDWVESIPFPIFGLRKMCGLCGNHYFTLRGYRGHYALEHILRLPPE